MSPIRLVIVTGLSGAGKASIMRVLEDLGYDAVDNPPLSLVEELVTRTDRNLAIGVDARSRGFDAGAVLATLERLRLRETLRPELVYAWAEEDVLLRRYTETRRRHPLAPHGKVTDGIAAEQAATAPLRLGADLVIDTSRLPLPELRRLIERHFGPREAGGDRIGLVVSLVSFAFPAGLPREADVVFDARFLRNPHYDVRLRPRTGHDAEVAAYVEADPDYREFYDRIAGLLRLLLPRFVQEGKKYATIAIGCSGGRHRSVHVVERLAADLRSGGWRLHVWHRELASEPTAPPAEIVNGGETAIRHTTSIQA
jgi:UPF0042 nucleotide-binding protein